MAPLARPTAAATRARANDVRDLVLETLSWLGRGTVPEIERDLPATAMASGRGDLLPLREHEVSAAIVSLVVTMRVVATGEQPAVYEVSNG